ncbi:hypothetical protein DFH09DRAFT_1180470 [Mycena vulgaris]|nr:hypothetical protein DFH09DRAFT_1180470 [Mycena vulgaris]
MSAGRRTLSSRQSSVRLVFCWLGLARKPWLWLGFVWLWLSIFQARAKASSRPGQARASGLSHGLSGKFSRSSS